MIDKSTALLDAIYNDVVHRLNPDNEECWHCGGDGETYDCIDGRIYAGRIAKAVREEVIKSGNLDLAVAWLKSIGRWRDCITLDQVRQQIEAAKTKLESTVPHHGSGPDNDA